MFKKELLLFLLCLPSLLFAKKPEPNKEDNTPFAKINNDVRTLCSAEYGGRLAGTPGEDLSATYIQNRFKSIGILPYKNKYEWEFDFKGGARIGNNAYFNIFDNKLTIGTDVIFLPYGKGNDIKGFALPNVNEPDNVWLIPISKLNLLSSNSPQKLLYEFASNCASKKANAIVFLNDVNISQDLTMMNLNTFESLNIPIVFMNYKAYQSYIKPNLKKDWIEVEAKMGYENVNILSKNVIASIDNKAPFNIVIAAHYDHLGNQGVLYQGADNNASGVAALLSVAEMVKNYGLKRFNYIFIAFSGTEFDLQGSKAFIQQNDYLLNNISCMINLDKVGRYDAIKKNIFINGVGTSPIWMPTLAKINKGFNLNIDSTGVGYGDYNSFYYKNIPVLNISTGYNDDYNRPSDDEKKINYQGIFEVSSYTYRLLSELDKQTKLIFNKTKEIVPDLDKLKTDIGIIHELTYNQNGCRIATTLPGSKADKAGMLSGDVLVKIGAFPIIDFEDYIEALTKTTKGVETTFIVKRDKKEYKFFLVL